MRVSYVAGDSLLGSGPARSAMCRPARSAPVDSLGESAGSAQDDTGLGLDRSGESLRHPKPRGYKARELRPSCALGEEVKTPTLTSQPKSRDGIELFLRR